MYLNLLFEVPLFIIDFAYKYSCRRQRFFQRNPHVQEAFDNFKSSPYKDFDVVSDHMLNTFISVCKLFLELFRYLYG